MTINNIAQVLTCLVKFSVSLSKGRLASLDSENLQPSMVLILAMARHAPELLNDLEMRLDSFGAWQR